MTSHQPLYLDESTSYPSYYDQQVTEQSEIMGQLADFENENQNRGYPYLQRPKSQ